MRKERYAEEKTSVSYGQTSAALTGWKKEAACVWLNEVSCVPLQQCLRHLQTAFRNFFEKRAAFPRFKSKHGKQGAEFTRSAFTWDGKHNNLRLAKIGHLRVRWSRQFRSEPSTVTITKNRAGQYFVTLCLDEQVDALPKTGKSVGIDLGINRLATLSNGERVVNPRFLAKKLTKLRRFQRGLSRKEKGRGRWHRQRVKVAKLHVQIANCRRDHLAKETTALVRRYDLLCMENLSVRDMMPNLKLSRGIADVGMSAFRQMLTYKCAWYGKELRFVDRFFPSSKRCSECHYLAETLPLEVRMWTCPNCTTVHDRDENAVRNILAEGHSVTARGGRVRPRATKVVHGSARRSVNPPALP
jgi:putative transposase